MFMPKFVVEKFTSFAETGLNRILAAKDGEISIIVDNKDEQIRFLRSMVDDLRSQVKHERERAEAAIDQLLIRDASSPAIRNADLQRDVAVRESLKAPRNDAPAKSRQVQFEAAIAGVGEDEGEYDPLERIEAIGGMQVEEQDKARRLAEAQ